MKHQHVLALLATSAALAAQAQAQSSVTITGYADASVMAESGGPAGSVKKLGGGVSGPTRLIFRGTEDLGGGLQAYFHLETGVLFDTGGSLQQNFWGRQSYVGMSGSFGSVRAGLTYNPIFTTLRDVGDPFRASYAGNSGNLFTVGMPAGPKSVAFPNSSAVTGTVATGALSRANTIHYFSPTIGGFSAEAAYSFGEQAGNMSALRTIGFAAGYSEGPLTVRFAGQNTHNATGTDRAENWLAAGSYDFGVVRVHAAYGTNKGYATAKSDDKLLAIAVPVGQQGKLLASYVAKNDKSLANNDAHQIAVGYLYNLSKRTHLHASIGRITNTVPNTSAAFYTLSTTAGPGTGDKLVAVGIGHFF